MNTNPNTSLSDPSPNPINTVGFISLTILNRIYLKWRWRAEHFHSTAIHLALVWPWCHQFGSLWAGMLGFKPHLLIARHQTRAFCGLSVISAVWPNSWPSPPNAFVHPAKFCARSAQTLYCYRGMLQSQNTTSEWLVGCQKPDSSDEKEFVGLQTYDNVSSNTMPDHGNCNRNDLYDYGISSIVTWVGNHICFLLWQPVVIRLCSDGTGLLICLLLRITITCQNFPVS